MAGNLAAIYFFNNKNDPFHFQNFSDLDEMDYEDEFVNTDDDDDFNRRFRLQSDSDMLHNINNANNLITSHPGRINNTNDTTQMTMSYKGAQVHQLLSVHRAFL